MTGQSIETPTWQAREYGEKARFVADLGAPVLDLLAPQPGETILDLGCGDGALTEKIAATGARVIGVDASADMVAAAQARGLEAYTQDAAVLDLPEYRDGVDAVFSNAALHWMPDAAAVITGVRRHLKAQGQFARGRFVGEFGGHGNVAAVATALRAVLSEYGLGEDAMPTWFFPRPEAYAALLARAGFTVEYMELIPRPTRVHAGMQAWLKLFAFRPLAKLEAAGLGEDARQTFLEKIETLLKPALQASDGVWWVDYVRLRFKAVV